MKNYIIDLFNSTRDGTEDNPKYYEYAAFVKPSDPDQAHRDRRGVPVIFYQSRPLRHNDSVQIKISFDIRGFVGITTPKEGSILPGSTVVIAGSCKVKLSQPVLCD